MTLQTDSKIFAFNSALCGKGWWIVGSTDKPVITYSVP